MTGSRVVETDMGHCMMAEAREKFEGQLGNFLASLPR
jgi:hypothetical protein